MMVESFSLCDLDLRRRYDDLFESCADAFIQQSTWWAETIKDLSPDLPIFLLCNDGNRDVAGLPLYLFQSDQGNILTSIPHHGPLGGVFCLPTLTRDCMENAYAALIQEAQSLAQKHRCITLTIITNPFLSDADYYLNHLKPECVFENFTQCMSISDVFSRGKITLKDYTRRSSTLSQTIRKAASGEFNIVFCESEADLDAWYRIHAARQKEVGAAPIHEDQVRNIFRILIPRRKAYLVLAKKGSRIVSGILYVRHRNVMDTLAISMDSEFSSFSPNYLLTEHSIPWFANLGVSTYNWQSMPTRNNGVYFYKKRWGGREKLYYFMTRILCSKDHLMKLGTDGLRKSYPLHFVVPFAALDDSFRSGKYQKMESHRIK